MKFINIPVFIISLAMGIFLVYILNPRPNIIYVYPNPDNIDKIQYKDKGGSCFGFTSQQVQCPNDKRKIRKYPVQEGKKSR
jgi:hypothetical protein